MLPQLSSRKEAQRLRSRRQWGKPNEESPSTSAEVTVFFFFFFFFFSSSYFVGLPSASSLSAADVQKQIDVAVKKAVKAALQQQAASHSAPPNARKGGNQGNNRPGKGSQVNGGRGGGNKVMAAGLKISFNSSDLNKTTDRGVAAQVYISPLVGSLFLPWQGCTVNRLRVFCPSKRDLEEGAGEEEWDAKRSYTL